MDETRRPPHGRVVVGVDGSQSAGLALDRAVEEAVRRAVPLEIVHGEPWTRYFEARPQYGAPSADDARALVEAAVGLARHLAPDLVVFGSPTPEDAASALVRRGREAALTVVGTRGHGGFTGLLLGSVSLRVAAHTAGPLLVVRGELPPRHNRVRHDTVLVGVESEADQDAAALAFAEAAARRAKLTVLRAWAFRHLTPYGGPLIPTSPVREDIARRSAAEAEAAERVVALLREKYPLVRTRVRTVHGGAAGALVEASRAADVVVIAVHRRGGPLALRLGPVTHALLHHAHCPVLLVPVEG